MDDNTDKKEYDTFFIPSWPKSYVVHVEDEEVHVSHLTASEVITRFEEHLSEEDKEYLQEQLATVQKNVTG